MATLPLLKISFDTQLASWEIPAFRNALIEKIGWDQQVEKNRYPLWQCKTHFYEGKQQALLVSLGKAAEQMVGKLHLMAGRLPLSTDRSVSLNIAACRSYSFQIHTHQLSHYRLFNYQPFNQLHYHQYSNLKQTEQKIELLQHLLARHLQVFASGIECHLTSNTDVQIHQIRKEKWIASKGIKALCFDLEFSSRIFLPEFIGLGRGAGRGFGVLRRSEQLSSDQLPAASVIQSVL